MKKQRPTSMSPEARKARERGLTIIGLRNNLGLSQRAAAEAAEISRSYLCDLERGRGTQLSLPVARRLAAVLNVPAVILFGEPDVVGGDDRDAITFRLRALEAQSVALTEAIGALLVQLTETVAALSAETTEPEAA